MRRFLILLLLLIVPLVCRGDGWFYGSAAAGGGLTCTHGSGDSAQYSHTGYSSNSSTFSDVRWKGLPFTLSAETRITSVDIYETGGDPTTVEIYNVSAGAPTSIANVNATSTVDPSADAQVVSFDFATPFTLAAGTYAVVIKGTSNGNNSCGYDAEAGHFYYCTQSGTDWGDDTNANGYAVVYGCQ